MTRAQSSLFSCAQLVFVLQISRDGGCREISGFLVCQRGCQCVLQNDEFDDEGRGGEMRIAKGVQLITRGNRSGVLRDRL